MIPSLVSRRSLLLGLASSAAVLSGCGKDEPTAPSTRSVVVPAVPQGKPFRSDPHALIAITIADGRPEKTSFAFRVLKPDGTSASRDASLFATITQLETGNRHDMTITAEDDGVHLSADPIDLDAGWVGLDIRSTVGAESLHSEAYVLLPDPNLRGFDAPSSDDSDPDAQKRFTDALARMSRWTSLRWWEWLSGGNASMITATFSVTTPAANNQPDAFSNHSHFAGIFPDDGSTPKPPKRDYSLQVTVGERGYQREATGTVAPASATQYLPITQYPETYEGANAFRSGMSTTLDGRPVRVVTLHLPTNPRQTEAWFAFWLDEKTNDPVKLAMVAANHYMIWDYFDVNQPFVIEPPR